MDFTPDNAVRTVEVFDEVRAQCEALELPAIVDHLRRVAAQYRRSSCTAVAVRDQCEHVLGMLHDGLAHRRFAYVPIAKSEQVDAAKRQWRTVWDKFPSAEEDCWEAVYCYALGRDTAAVFHSMLVLEHGLKSLARRLRVKAGGKDWGSILDKIEDAIAEKRKLKASKSVKRAAATARADNLTFYSEAAKEFSYFKDAWRNHTAHGRKRYDEFESARIVTHVREFMSHLATRLKEVR